MKWTLFKRQIKKTDAHGPHVGMGQKGAKDFQLRDPLTIKIIGPHAVGKTAYIHQTVNHKFDAKVRL